MLDRNVRLRAARSTWWPEGDELVFVEVKTRIGDDETAPDLAVTAAKLARLERLAEAYVSRAGDEEWRWRVDVVAIVIERSGRVCGWTTCAERTSRCGEPGRARSSRREAGRRAIVAVVSSSRLLVVRAAAAPGPGRGAHDARPQRAGRDRRRRGDRRDPVRSQRPEELHPASLTKMVTALVAVERAPLDKMRAARPTTTMVTPVLIGIWAGDSCHCARCCTGCCSTR